MRISEMENSTRATNSKSCGRKKSINEAYEELKGCSPEQLMEKLATEIKGQKLNGTFDYDGLCATIEKLKMYLPTQTYENMMRIIESLK